VPLFLAAQERWVEFLAGPFEVMTSAGERSGRETLAQLEQLRWALGTVLGKPELKTVWPVRVVVRKAGPGWSPVPPKLSRDAYVGGLVANAPIPRLWLRECARILIDSSAGRMPAGIEAGLADFYSTEELSGVRITDGRPLPEAERNLNWARIHLLSVHPDYYGKPRVLLHNLQQGAEMEPACRNAFGKTPAQIDKEAAAYLAAGNFATIEISGRPLNPQRDLRAQPVSAPAPEIALADLAPSRAAYEAILKAYPKTPAALEGLGLWAKAIEAGSKNARAYVEHARQSGDRPALVKAIELNPAWAEPRLLLGQRDKNIQELKTAGTLEPRNARYWQALAEESIAQNQYPEAAKAWAAAEHASVDDSERAHIRVARLAIEQQRLDYEAAERRRAAEEAAKDIERAKAAALAEVRAAEARANRKDPTSWAGRKVEPWWEGEIPSGKLRGRLTQVDCRGATVRFVIQGEDGKLTRLVIRDPKKVVVLSGGQLDFTCGPQRKPRTVSIEYFPKNDAKLATAGEVATIEYP